MSRKVIVHIHNDALRIGEALRLICDGVGYDNTYFERDCAWRLSDGNCVYVDLARNKKSIRFDIWKDKKQPRPVIVGDVKYSSYEDYLKSRKEK